jgi:alkyl hydroperoxide reductase subunit AhpC
MARIKHEFDRRNTKIIGLSVDALQDHGRWASDVTKTHGAAPDYPSWAFLARSINGRRTDTALTR